MARFAVVAWFFLCLGTGSLVVEAVRVHESFATTTYYPDKETKSGTQPSSELPDDKKTDESIPNRYPQGYPSNPHHYNPQTAQYTVEGNDPAVDPAGERYPHGYYPDSQYTQANKLPAVVTNITSSSYTVVDGNVTDNTTRPIPDRYPGGYPGSNTKTTDPLPGTSVEPTGERYPHGYYPTSEYTQTTTSVVPNPQSGVQFSAQNYQPGATVDTPGERYPHGYYPNSQYTNSLPSNTQQTGGVQYSNQPTQTYPVGDRYAAGYYSGSQYSANQPKPVSYSYEGNFNTLPVVNNAGELPFGQTGAGCRTAYWINNPSKWPKFLGPKSTVEDAFGSKVKDVYGEMTVLQGLLSYGTDPYSELLRSGCTAILNSYIRGGYSISHVQVIEEFNAALSSKDAAATQALAFETANVMSISAGNACT